MNPSHCTLAYAAHDLQPAIAQADTKEKMMDLREFPRPPQDNGRGVHWSLSPYEWGQRDWSFWAEQLLAMKIKWVKIIDDGGGSTLPLARRLVDLQIMPVVRLYWAEPNPGNIGQRGQETVKRYLDVGAVYFETNNEPDLTLEWKRGNRPPNWLEIVVDNFVIDADLILEQGGYPAMPAFGVGTLRDPFSQVVKRGRRDILDGGAWAAVHNYCLARPLEYPNDPVNIYGEPLTEEEWLAAGGMRAWEMSWEAVNQARREFANPDASILTDATCFRAFEQLNTYVVRAVGHSIPIMMTEGGYNVGQRAGTTEGDDPRYPKPSPQATSQLNLDMYKYMQGDRKVLDQYVPDYYFASMAWLIAVQRIGVAAPPAENQGPWFTHIYDQEWGLNGELPLVQMLKDMPSHLRQDGPVPALWHKAPTPDKLGHDWDARLNYLGVKLEPARQATGGVSAAGDGQASGLYWKLVAGRWLNQEEAHGASQIFVKALDAHGDPIENATFVVKRPDAQDQARTKGAIDSYWGNYTMYGMLGTYKVEMAEGGYPSEQVIGVGLGTEELPNAWSNTAFRFTFQLTEGKHHPEVTGASTSAGGTAPSVIETAPTAPAGPEELSELARALRKAAQPHIMPLDPNSPLFVYARQHELGERLSDIFMFEHAGTRYSVQVFETGIVYAPADKPDQVTHI
jgi:hypothetical protein